MRGPGARSLVWLALLACGCPDLAESPPPQVPSSPTRHTATSQGETEADPLFDPSDFERLPPPRSDSWRSRVREPRQSLVEFSRIAAREHSPARPTLYLQPLADYPREPVLAGDLPALPLVEDGFVTFVFAPAPEDLRDFIEAFYGRPTRVAPELELESLVPGPARIRRHHGQFNAHQVLAALEPRVPADAHSMTALMARDLFASDEQEYAFGHAIHEDRVAVASFAQLDPQFIGHGRKPGFRGRIRARAYKLVAHEIGHTLGFEHCDEYRCVMNGVAHVTELDESPLHLGPDCLAKLAALGEFDPVARYRRLATHLVAHGLGDEAAWALRRAERLEERPKSHTTITP